MTFRVRTIYTEIDFHNVRMTMAQVFEAVRVLQERHPSREVYMDGDLYAIVSAEYSEQSTLDEYGAIA